MKGVTPYLVLVGAGIVYVAAARSNAINRITDPIGGFLDKTGVTAAVDALGSTLSNLGSFIGLSRPPTLSPTSRRTTTTADAKQDYGDEAA